MIRRSLLALVLTASLAASAFGQSAVILNGATAIGPGSALTGIRSSGNKTYQVYASTTSGTGTASVSVEGSINGAMWDAIGSVTLSLTTSPTSNSFTSADRFTQVRGNVTALTGTGATATVLIGN